MHVGMELLSLMFLAKHNTEYTLKVENGYLNHLVMFA